jgi:hypothetical protein
MVIAFTVAGAAASIAVGALIGYLGALVFLDEIRVEAMLAMALLATLAVARDLGYVSIPFPQPRRQTREVWGKLYPRPVGAILWGFDLGLVFTTRFTFSGPAVLLALALSVASPLFGATLLATHWLGRASTVWLGPSLLPDANATPLLMDRIERARVRFQSSHVVAILWLATVLIVTAASRASI